MSKRGNSRRVTQSAVDNLLALSLDELHARGRVAGQKLSHITEEMIAVKTEIANISAAIRAKRNGDDNIFGVSDHAVLRYLERVRGLDVKAVRDEIRTYVQARVEAGRQNQIIDMGDGISAAVTDSRTVATVWTDDFVDAIGLEQAALEFAKKAHAGQTRKYTGEAYIVHPIAVADIVRTVAHDEAMLATALLHDVVEDCGVPLSDIQDRFGSDVAELVDWLTDASRPSDGNRKARKAIDREHIAAAPARAQTIKVADLIDNTKSIVARDPDFARVYMREKELLIDVLVRADPALISIAKAHMEEYTGIIH